MGLFSKSIQGIFVVLKDDAAKETYVKRVSLDQYQSLSIKYGSLVRYDNDKEAIKVAKSCMKSIPGWKYNKDRNTFD